MSNIIVTICLSLTIVFPTVASALVAEVDDTQITAVYDRQGTPVWCWAASIEMVLNYYGFKIDQPTIVQRTFGAVVPVTGDFIAITRNLNYSFESKGKKYIISASMLQVNNNPFNINPWAATPEAFVTHLKKGRPIVVAYQSSIYSGHAVVLSGVTYTINSSGRVELSSLTVRDPFPYNQNHIDNRGKISYQNGRFPGQIQAIWFVDITEA